MKRNTVIPCVELVEITKLQMNSGSAVTCARNGSMGYV